MIGYLHIIHATIVPMANLIVLMAIPLIVVSQSIHSWVGLLVSPSAICIAPLVL